MSNQWNRRVRANAIGHLDCSLSYQAIQADRIEDIPCLVLTGDRPTDMIIRNRCIECLTYACAYNGSKEVGLWVKQTPPYNIVWQQYGQVTNVAGGGKEYSKVMKNTGCLQIVMIHNHPNSSELQANDMIQFLRNPKIVAVIAVGNSCDRIFSMIKTSAFRIDYCNQLMDQLKSDYDLTDLDKLQRDDNREIKRRILQELSVIGIDYITNNWWEV